MKKFILAILVVVLAVSAASAFSGREREIVDLKKGISSGLKVSGNAILFGTEVGDIYAINKNTGRMIWAYNVAGSVVGTPAVVDGNAIFADREGVVTCLRIADGAFIWQNLPPASESVSATMSDGVTVGGGMAFFTRDDGNLYAVDAKNGSVLWTFAGGAQRLRNAPGYGENTVFLPGYDGKLDIISPNNGKRISGGGAGGALNTPVVANGNVYFSAWDGSVQGVKIKDIIPLWDTKLSDVVTTSPAVKDGIIAVGTGRGVVATLDEKTGNILWNVDISGSTGGEIISTPVISGGLVFAVNAQGVLYALNEKNGEVRYNHKFGGGAHIADDNGTIYIAGGGSLYVLQ